MKKYIWALLSAYLVLSMAHASGSHDHDITIINEGDTHVENIFIEGSGISSSDLDAAFAGSMAVSQVQCNTSSRKHQGGFGIGKSGSEYAFAGGYCHSIGNSPKYAQTLGGSVLLLEGGEQVYGGGYNFQW